MKTKLPTTIAIACIVLGTVGMVALWCPRAAASDPSLELTQYAHAAWTAREGLKDNVRSIAQTPDGYLWLGTDFGLVRFDGVRFVRWSAPQGQRLPSARIQTLLAARDGALWIGTLEGLASWKDGKLIQYPEIAGQAVYALLEDHQRTIWVGGIGKLCAIQSGRVKCSDLQSGGRSIYGNPAPAVYSLYEDHERRLWVGAESGLWQWEPALPQPLPQPILTFQSLVEGEESALTWRAAQVFALPCPAKARMLDEG
jgi:ligand-binding sensor domain-containing protein